MALSLGRTTAAFAVSSRRSASVAAKPVGPCTVVAGPAERKQSARHFLAVRPSSARFLARASSTDQSAQDLSAKVQEQLTVVYNFLKKKWDETDDDEKPAAVAIIVASIVAQVAIGATIDAVDRIPLLHQFFEFLGLAVVLVYGYRYTTDPVERSAVNAGIQNFLDAVTGDSEAFAARNNTNAANNNSLPPTTPTTTTKTDANKE